MLPWEHVRLVAVFLVAGLGCTDNGPRANYIFATSSLHTGAFGSSAAADAICAQAASDAKLDGTYVAWISGAPFDRLEPSRGWIRLDGVAVADQPADFLKGGLLAPVTVDELGHAQHSGDTYAWTGIAGDGSQNQDCTGWTTAASTATVGRLEGGGTLFTDDLNITCDRAAHLICTEIGNTTPFSVTKATGRTAFISSDVWAPGAGITDADLVCQTEAQQASLAGTYLAVLPTSTASASSRFDLSGPPWIRVDGAQLAPTAAQLFTADYLSTYVNQNADGSLADASLFVWGGEPTTIAFPTETCQDWTFTTASAMIGGVQGFIAVDHKEAFNWTQADCNLAEHLLCLQE